MHLVQWQPRNHWIARLTSDDQYGIPDRPEDIPTMTCARNSFQVHSMSLLHNAAPCAAAPAHRLRDKISGFVLPSLTIPETQRFPSRFTLVWNHK
jgi:hypothetical protein